MKKSIELRTLIKVEGKISEVNIIISIKKNIYLHIMELIEKIYIKKEL